MPGIQKYTGETLTIGDREIRRDGDMWCLTDLWRAGGSPKTRRPNDWLGTEVAVEFSEYVSAANPETTARGCSLKKKGNPRTGEPPTTWAHWQLAMAYAKTLSPELHARVNEVWRAFMAGQLVPRNPSWDAEELIRFKLRVAALERDDYESLWSTDVKLELARLRKLDWKSKSDGPEPQPLAFAYGFTWRMLLGESVYRELQRRNPSPSGVGDGTLHGQWLQRQTIADARSSMQVVLFIARRALNWADYERQMKEHFRRVPVQMRLASGQ